MYFFFWWIGFSARLGSTNVVINSEHLSKDRIKQRGSVKIMQTSKHFLLTSLQLIVWLIDVIRS